MKHVARHQADLTQLDVAASVLRHARGISVAVDVIGNIVDCISILVIRKRRFLNEFIKFVKYLDLPVYYSTSLYRLLPMQYLRIQLLCHRR